MKTYYEFLTYFQHNPNVAGVMAPSFNRFRNSEYKRALRDFLRQQITKIEAEYEEEA